MTDSLAKAAGAAFTLNWKGETYIVDAFDISDWGMLQNHCTRLKRKQYLEMIKDTRDLFDTEDEWRIEWEKAKKEAAAISDVTLVEAQQFSETENGASFLLWIMLERRYPGKFKQTDILKVMYDNDIQEEDFEELQNVTREALGLGNETGQKTIPIETPATDSKPDQSSSGSEKIGTTSSGS